MEEAVRRYEERLRARIAEYSIRAMSNAKWRKVLKSLAEFAPLRAYVKLLLDAEERHIGLYSALDSGGAEPYGVTAIADNVVFGCGSVLYKEIEYLSIPFSIVQKRYNREEVLEPRSRLQPIDGLTEELAKLGKLLIEENQNDIRIFGYK